ncbi:unnamed protein product [Heligmosomoides polygyrus]|uniref:Doublecortin domain-containing protein n=1 Tax=Heligmosomoides polygyrus TaxID=6339 RepID=A0A3P7YYL5_HELPZ|nr:unnamed protein product [Heligmosomoides polygyrus]
MNSAERREFELDFTGPPPRVQFDFRAIRIRVYKNGDERDPGKLITVTRREYKHWIVFLDALTRKLGTTTAINRLYSTHGVRVDHFTELEHNGEYVAVERGPFIDCNYGANRVWTQTERKWTSLVRVTEGKPIYLHSGDSMDLFLKKAGYGSTTGLPFPLDGLSKSPNLSAANLSGLSKEKLGGSLEQLNKAGNEMWTEDNHSISMSNIRGGETKEKKEKKVSTREPDQSTQAERKEVEETTDVKEYAMIDKPLPPWEGRSGTVFEKKEMMHEVVTEGPRPTIWREKRPRGRAERMTEVVRTYEKVREYRRFIDEFDPDFVD